MKIMLSQLQKPHKCGVGLLRVNKLKYYYYSLIICLETCVVSIHTTQPYVVYKLTVQRAFIVMALL